MRDDSVTARRDLLKRIDVRLAKHRLNRESWNALVAFARALEMPRQVIDALLSKVVRCNRSIMYTERHKAFVEGQLQGDGESREAVASADATQGGDRV